MAEGVGINIKTTQLKFTTLGIFREPQKCSTSDSEGFVNIPNYVSYPNMTYCWGKCAQYYFVGCKHKLESLW